MISPPAQPVPTAETAWASLLAQHASMEHSLYELPALIAAARGTAAHRLILHENFYRDRLATARDAYAATVPTVSLSRCPLTQEPLVYPVETRGLEGLWWRYEAAVRPFQRPLPSLFAVTGAVRLNGPPAWAPFLCKPGPEAPFVLPRLLDHPGITAVLSSLDIGAHTGYAIIYFSVAVSHDVPRPNHWGMNRSVFTAANGLAAWDAQPEDPAEFDFALAPWIESGKLLWIAPGDTALTLRRTAGGCPYLDLPGTHNIVRIQQGERW